MSSSLKISPQFTIDHLFDLALDQTLLDQKKYPESELIELFHNNKSKGIFWQVEIKDYLKEYPHLFDEPIIVRSKGSQEACALPEYPLFQRRKPQLIPDNVTIPNDLYLLLNGQKVGPLTKEQIFEKLDTHEVMHHQLISIDNGVTFKKIHLIKEFDRRGVIEKDHLPPLPTQSLGYTAIHEKGAELDALAGLAFIEKVNAGKLKPIFYETGQFEKPSIEELTAPLPSPEVPLEVAAEVEIPIAREPSQIVVWIKSHLKEVGIGFGIVILLMAITQIDWKKSQEKNSGTKKEAPILKGQKIEPSEVGSKNRKINRRGREEREANRRELLRKKREEVKSFRESKSYKTLSDSPENYDTGETPVEQDPVRSRLDKETIDPIEPIEEFAPGEETISPIVNAQTQEEVNSEGPKSEENLFEGGATY